MKTCNGKVAVTPFVEKHLVVEVKNAFALGTTKLKLQKLTVVFGSSEVLDLEPGDGVYVRADQVSLSWAKEVFDLGDGKQFILMPKESILIHEKAGV